MKELLNFPLVEGTYPPHKESTISIIDHRRWWLNDSKLTLMWFIKLRLCIWILSVVINFCNCICLLVVLFWCGLCLPHLIVRLIWCEIEWKKVVNYISTSEGKYMTLKIWNQSYLLISNLQIPTTLKFFKCQCWP